MRIKRLMSVLLATALLITSVNLSAVVTPVSAEGNKAENNVSGGVQFEGEHYKYYYAQLSSDAKKIYDAMYYMYSQGMMKKGNENYDLVEHGYVSQQLASSWAKGSNDLIIAVETARDAFYLDYPEVFYVNMERFSIRITMDSEKNYHVWLGTGNNSSYYNTGFTSEADVDTANSAYENKLNQIVSGAKALTAEADENLAVKQIEYVHEQVLKSTTYKLDDVCKPQNAGHIRTPYGALVAGESVCEGYSKAMKVALDKLGIPCILIRGVYTHEATNVEAHMWNYVQVDGKWYAVDATFDDDDSENVYTRYLLAGDYLMSQGHATDGVMSAPEFEFTYPDLEGDNYGVKEVASEDGLVVKYETTNGAGGYDASTFHISYKGMGFAEAAKQGYHFIIRYYQLDKNNKLTVSNWCYVLNDTDYFPAMITDSKNQFELTVYYMQYLEIAATNVPIGPYNDKKNYTDLQRLRFLNYLGDTEHMLAQSGLLECPDANYVPAPQITSASPYIESKLKPGKSTHVKVTYDEPLVLKNESVEPSVLVETNAWTSSASDNSIVKNFKWNGQKTVEFDFVPSTQWGDNSVFYYFSLNNLVGSLSNREPVPAHYYVQESFGCTYSMKTSGVWRVYGRPTLVESSDLSESNWKLNDGSTVSGSLTDRLALVTTQTSSADANTMNNLVEKNFKNEVLKSETYNISLSLCQKNVVQTGHKLTVYLGFPEGYGPDDAGVTFKAYHFIYKYGEIAGVEEIPCVVTPYGLLVTCSAFSPFEVAAVKATQADMQDTSKTVAITAGENGSIVNLDNSLVTLNEGESKTYTVRANDGYQIDTITVCGKNITEGVGEETAQITVNYDDVLEGNNIVNVTFVAKTVVEAEEERGEEVVVQELELAEIETISDQYTSVGRNFTISPSITASNGIDSYQWYKDGVEIAGQTSAELTFDAVTKADAGTYQLVVTSTLDTIADKVSSNEFTLTVLDNIMNIEDCTISPVDDYDYTGEKIEPQITITKDEATLVEGEDYTIKYDDNIEVGTAKITIQGIAAYEGKKVIEFQINQLDLSNTVVSIGNDSYVYTGSKITTTATVKLGEKTLTYGKDYTVDYENNINVGTATVVVTGIGNYTGSVTKTFEIKKATNAVAEIDKVLYEYNGKVQKPSVKVTCGGKALVSGTDYKVTYGAESKKVGRYKVEVKFQGNYSGEKTLYYTICPKATSVSKLKAGKKKITVTWKKQSAETNGYQIQYATNSSFKKAKMVKVKKNKTVSMAITKLAKKKYFVRIRTYKKVSGVTYYSVWSKAKSVKVK